MPHRLIPDIGSSKEKEIVPQTRRTLLPCVLSICSIESLSLEYVVLCELIPSTPVNLKHLKTLYIDLDGRYWDDYVNWLVPQLGALEDLDIRLSSGACFLDLKSVTMKKLKLDLNTPNLRISAPSLELFELRSEIHKPSVCWDWELPMLKRADIHLSCVSKWDVQDVYTVLNNIAHVQELHLSITELWREKDTFHALLVPFVDPPIFIRLKHFHLEICFHEFNIEDLVTIIQHSPALESLKLVHKPPYCLGKDKKGKLWRSKLPQNVEGNYRHAYFRDLNIAEKKDELLKKLTRKQSSKRQKR